MRIPVDTEAYLWRWLEEQEADAVEVAPGVYIRVIQADLPLGTHAIMLAPPAADDPDPAASLPLRAVALRDAEFRRAHLNELVAETGLEPATSGL